MRIFLLIILASFSAVAQDGEWKYIDGWVYTPKKEDNTAGGAIIEKKLDNTIINNNSTKESNTKQEVITRYAPCRGQFITMTKTTTTYKSGEFFGLPFEVRTVHSGAKTPEPTTSNLLLVGLLTLFSLNNKRNRNAI